jgi:PAS domain S-box-containing protein
MNSTLPALLGESTSFAFAICEVIFDAEQRPIQAICCELNPFFADLVGKPLTELLGKDFYLEDFNLIAQLRKDEQQQIFYQQKDQQYKVDTIYREQSREVLIVFTNITSEIQLYSLQYKSYKDKAEEADEHYSRLVSSSSDPILLFGNGVFIEVNDAAAHFLGYKNKSELLMVSPVQLAPEFQPNGESTMAFSIRMNGIALEKGYHRFETVHLKADGSPILVEVSLTTIRYQGETIFYCGWRDLTAEKQREQNLIEQQERMLLELSTPITQLWRDILLLPLVGRMNSKRAQNILSAVLQKIGSTQTKVFILDIAGVDLVDTAVANSFIRLAKATRLMGCQCIISGISPQVAQTIVELGIHVDEINTTGDLQTALQKGLQLTGKQITA